MKYIAKNAHFTPKKEPIGLKTGLIFTSFSELSISYCGPTLWPPLANKVLPFNSGIYAKTQQRNPVPVPAYFELSSLRSQLE